MAEASLPDMRARSKPGTAIAAMMPMIATTISNSIRVKPFDSRIFMFSLLGSNSVGRPTREQPWCQQSRIIYIVDLEQFIRTAFRKIALTICHSDNYWRPPSDKDCQA